MTQGHVAIVGAGPGDPELITLKGGELLKQADVVLVDHLAPQDLLRRLRPDVEVVHVGKYPHRPSTTQEEIEALLVERALAGLRVVRLKGGDPFVFGRGGEEALACLEHGIPFDVVPGVTSAVAVPASAGIPVTHRGVTQDVTVVSGHVAPDDPRSSVDWERLGAGTGTVVVLMGVTHLDRFAAALQRGGRAAGTPAAVVENGTLPGERTVVGTLATIAADVEAAGLRPPAVLVVGEVVALRARLRPGSAS
ncbi:uroporphyrinogen-III C-methyltransferase [Vallicoccus soli]|uniref:uroporphyrinogen-III C-methyltransferase n=1 Tax=Vallicoccus soli TaxID=2339232 RepID=A0A3A3ZL65_9ACTN|nr:uroporphyrinogen-III C-methyltransferase [Vallicoccus soli]RJK96842.1 uroporphyrinogen-III C-methyltransferase [Vallicoccus soli]